VVLVVGGDVVDAGVQPEGVVLDAQALQLGVENSRVADLDKVGPVGLEVTVEALDVGLIGRVVPGRPWCWAMAISAMKSRVGSVPALV
jgi:hypothetical protein